MAGSPSDGRPVRPPNPGGVVLAIAVVFGLGVLLGFVLGRTV